jgi:hypothetical protein
MNGNDIKDAPTLLKDVITQSAETARGLHHRIKEYKKAAMRAFLYHKETSPAEDGNPRLRWPASPLRDVAALIEGPDGPESFGPFMSETGAPLILPDCVESLRFQPRHSRFVSDAESRFAHYRVAGADIIFVREGSDAGASAIYPVFAEPGVLGKGLIGIRPDAKRCEHFYLLNVLHFYYHAGILGALARGGRIEAGPLGDIPVPVPPFENQKEITGLMLGLSGGMVAAEEFQAGLVRLENLL